MTTTKYIENWARGEITHASVELTASGNVGLTSGVIVLNGTAAIAGTITATPNIGDRLTVINISAGTHTLALPSGVTWDGTNATATFTGSNYVLESVAVSSARWWTVVNTGTVTFS